MSDDFEPVVLSNGDRLTVDPWTGDGDADPGGIAVEVLRTDGSSDEIVLPYPRHGLGGGRIIVSPSERFALLHILSGQSEEGYELFTLGRGITRVAGLGYQVGESASYCFSSDETVLVMALPASCIEWWLPWDEGEAEPDGNGRRSFGFGHLRLHEIASGVMSVHELRISAAEGWEPARADYDPDLEPRFISPRELALSMPWGTMVVPLPAPDIVVCPVDSIRRP